MMMLRTSHLILIDWLHPFLDTALFIKLIIGLRGGVGVNLIHKFINPFQIKMQINYKAIKCLA